MPRLFSSFLNQEFIEVFATLALKMYVQCPPPDKEPSLKQAMHSAPEADNR